MGFYLNIVAFSILGLVLILLLTKKQKNRSDFVLAVWLMVLAFHLWILMQLPELGAAWMQVNEVLSFSHGLFLWWYVRSLLDPNTSFKKPLFQLLALLGVAFLLVRFIPAYWETPLLIFGLKGLAILIYLWMTFRQVQQTPMERPLLRWVYFLIAGTGLLLLLPALHSLFDPASFVASQNLAGNLLYCVFILLLGFVGIRMAPIFIETAIERKQEKPKYSNSNLDNTRIEQTFTQLQKLMSDGQAFLDPELTIKKVSEELQTNTTYLSEVINSQTGKRFNEYVNGFRVELLKEKLARKEHQEKTLLAIALECGFNSKASFNRAFRRHTDMTPTEYIRLVLPDA